MKALRKTIVQNVQKKMPPKNELKVHESPEINLIWLDDEIQLILESVRNFKKQKARKGIDWQTVKEKQKKIKDIFREILLQQLNEYEFPHSARISPFICQMQKHLFF